jgi:peptidyl-prolyl cis-trans isomerase SurA
MRIGNHHRLIHLAASAFILALSSGWSGAHAQNIVVLVNDEPITSVDVAQRIRWMARTSGFGDRMKAELDMHNPVKKKALEDKYRQLMIAANPRSEAEAQAAAERIKKQLLEEVKNRVLSEGGGGGRKAAIEALIEDKLKLQAAKKLEIKVTDKEVEEVLSQRTGGGEGKKADLTEFYQQFEKDGISRRAVQDVIRAQIAWRDVIRRQYGPRIASLISVAPVNEEKPSENDIQFDVRVLRLAVSNSSDQRAVSQRMLEAENLKNKFTSCADLAKEAKLVSDATVRSISKAQMASFPKDAQPLVAKASEGQMTPPVLVGNAVESYAICKKSVAASAKQKAPAEQKPDVRQQEFERFARRYLQELKQSASIDYRGS